MQKVEVTTPRAGPGSSDERVDHAVGRALAGTHLLGRDVAERDVDGAHPRLLGAPDVVVQAVADVDAARRVGDADGVHRRRERAR